MKENALKAAISVVLAGAMAYFRELAFPVIVLTVVMVLDYLSGMASAWVKRELSSRVGILGIVKKLAYLLAVAVAIVVDWVVQTAADELGLNLGAFCFFGLLVTIWLILNECISILENISEIGVPLPTFLMKLVEKLEKTVENAGETESGVQEVTKHDESE